MKRCWIMARLAACPSGPSWGWGSAPISTSAAAITCCGGCATGPAASRSSSTGNPSPALVAMLCNTQQATITRGRLLRASWTFPPVLSSTLKLKLFFPLTVTLNIWSGIPEIFNTCSGDPAHYELSFTGCRSKFLNITCYMYGILFVHASTTWRCFCLQTFCLNNGIGMLPWTSYIPYLHINYG